MTLALAGVVAILCAVLFRLTMTLDELKTQVAANTAVEASAVLLIQGLAAKLSAIATDPIAIASLASSLQTSAAALAAAVAANTPAPAVAPTEPAPPVAPPASLRLWGFA